MNSGRKITIKCRIPITCKFLTLLRNYKNVIFRIICNLNFKKGHKLLCQSSLLSLTLRVAIILHYFLTILVLQPNLLFYCQPVILCKIIKSDLHIFIQLAMTFKFYQTPTLILYYLCDRKDRSTHAKKTTSNKVLVLVVPGTC